MNRDIQGLRNHLFAQLEKLGDEDLTGCDLEQEIERARSISQISATILETAKAEFKYMELTGASAGSAFIESVDQKRLGG